MNSVLLTLSQFHFLRPWWLLAIIPALIIGVLLWRHKRQSQQWQSVIAPELLPHLLDGESVKVNPWYLLALMSAWLIAALALAGPTWEKRPVAVEKNQQALVLVLDLSPSMLSQDLKPSRLIRARLKIADILRERSDGQTALIVYAGDAHGVIPLTDDSKTINNLLPTLSPNIMPIPGSNTEAAIEKALAMLRGGNLNQGDILLITDGVNDDAISSINNNMHKSGNFRLSILGVGSFDPTPIPSPKGGFLRDSNNAIVTTKLEPANLRALADNNGGRYYTISTSDADINYLMNIPLPEQNDTQKVDRDFDSWYDQGHWLVLALLPIILYCFRRGILIMILLAPLAGLTPQTAQALEWNQLWKNNNQQALAHLQNNEAEKAAEQFTNPDWKAAAEYRAGHYDKAAELYAQNNTASADYNRGNALAKSGKIDEAMKAYEQALKKDPQLKDAQKNLDLLKKLKQQNQENQQDSKDDKKDQQQNSDDKNQQDKNQQNSDQSQDQKNQQDQQQSQDKNSQDQKNQDQQTQNQQNQQQQDQQQNQQGQQNSSAMSDKDQQQAGQGSSSSEANTQSAQQQKTDEEQKAEEQKAQAMKEAQEKADEENAQERQTMVEKPEDQLTDEERQAMEQWLRRVPDEPGNLLQNKFYMEYQKHRRDQLNGDYESPDNKADSRW